MKMYVHNNAPLLLLVQLCCFKDCQGHIQVSYTPRLPAADPYYVSQAVSSIAYFSPWQSPWPSLDESLLTAGCVYFCGKRALEVEEWHLQADPNTIDDNVVVAPPPEDCLLLYEAPWEDANTNLTQDAAAQDDIYTAYLEALADDDYNSDEHGSDTLSDHTIMTDPAWYESEIEIQEAARGPTVMIVPWTVDLYRDNNMTQLMKFVGQFMHQVQTTKADFIVVLLSGMDWKETTLFWATGGLPYGLEMLMDPVIEDEALRWRDDSAGKDKYDNLYSLKSSPLFLVVLDNDHGTYSTPDLI